MKRLNKKGLEMLENIQNKYKFQNTFQITEPEEIYDCCSDIKKNLEQEV